MKLQLHIRGVSFKVKSLFDTFCCKYSLCVLSDQETEIESTSLHMPRTDWVGGFRYQSIMACARHLFFLFLFFVSGAGLAPFAMMTVWRKRMDMNLNYGSLGIERRNWALRREIWGWDCSLEALYTDAECGQTLGVEKQASKKKGLAEGRPLYVWLLNAGLIGQSHVTGVEINIGTFEQKSWQ
jgi:hypothetical protein